MSIKSRLPKATFIALVFHWSWITGLFFSLNLFQTKAQLSALEIRYENLTVLNQIGAQITIAQKWLGVSIPAILIAAAIGFFSAWVYAKYRDVKRRQRMSGNGEFRGITCTLGTLPKPESMRFQPIGIELPNGLKLGDKHHKLLCDILSLINSHEVPAGVGHSDLNLLQHSINTIEKAIKINRKDPNLICAIAAHDIGKINTFKQKDGKWIVEGKHDDEGAKIIRELESWWELSDKDRFTILYSVKYSHKPTMVPTQIEYREEIIKCIEGIRHIDHNVTRVEKEETVTKLEEQKTLYDYFLQFLQVAPFRSPASPAGTKSGGWIKNNHCFMLESYFKDIYLKENHPEILAAYNELGKKKDNSRVSRELLKQLNAKKLLVKEWDGEKIGDPTQALWAIQCGSSTFIKVIIIPLTEEIHTLVGDQKFHQPLKVISSFSKYKKAQKMKHASGKPQANVSQESKGNRLEEDLKKIKNEKAKKTQDEQGEHNTKNKDTVTNSNHEKPNANKSEGNKISKRKKKHAQADDNDDTIDNMFASFATKPSDNEAKKENQTQVPTKEGNDKEIKNRGPKEPIPPQKSLSSKNTPESKAEEFREELGIREIDIDDSVI